MKNKFTIIILFFSILVLLISPFIGIQDVTLSSLRENSIEKEIFYKIRLPRVLMSFLAGSILALGGLVFQAMFKNPIATPFTLGVSSGASLGTAIYFFLGFNISLPIFFGGSVFALVGALLSIVIVYGTASLMGAKNNAGLLLVGVALNFLCSALIMFIQFSVDLISANRIIYYMIGSISGSNMQDVLMLLPIGIIGSLIMLSYRRELDLLSMGDETATARGLNTKTTSAIIYFTISIMIGCVVALCGPIGFVGMMVPHICRIFVGSSSINLMPVTIIFGGAFLTICDTIARNIFAPTEMPVGIITSMLGAPFFIFLIIKNKRI